MASRRVVLLALLLLAVLVAYLSQREDWARPLPEGLSPEEHTIIEVF